jgi:hypothetical protein
MITTPVTIAADEAVRDLEEHMRQAVAILDRIRQIEAAIPSGDDPAELRATALACARVAKQSLTSCMRILKAAIASARNSREMSVTMAELQMRLAVDQATRPDRVVN